MHPKYVRPLLVFLTVVFVAVLAVPRISPWLMKSEDENIPEKIKRLYGEGEEGKAERQDRPDQALLYEKMLRSEFGKPFSYHGNWRFSALKKAREMQSARQKSAAEDWVERGPSNIGGRSRAIVAHPNNPAIWWAGSVGGGVWKTEDAGAHWRPVTDDMPALSVAALVVCPGKPDILYAGTGEGFGNYDGIVGDGIFKSEDGGEHWRQLEATAGEYDFRYVNRLVVHPLHSDTVLAATNNGILRTLDGGESWEKVLSASHVQQIVANPQNFNTLLAALLSEGIYKSTDMGTTWTKVSEEITDHRRIEIAISPTDTNYVYAAVANSDGGLKGFYQSTDGGNTWINKGNSTNWLGKQGWYDNTLVVHPFDPQVVFVGGLDLYQVDLHNGMQVVAISNWWGGNGLPYVHADHHCLTAIPNNDQTFALLDANDGGIFYSPNGGVDWESKDNGYNVTQYYDGDRHPFLNQFIGGSQDNGTSISPVDPDAQSSWHKVVGGDGFDCAWDYYDPYNVYATLYDSRIYKSTDGGNRFTSINNGLPESNIFHTPLVMAPLNPQKLFTVSEQNKIYLTVDGGQKWHGYDVNLGGHRWIRIAVSPVDTSVVWIAGSSGTINVSHDGGRTFQTVTRPDGSPDAMLTGLATHPSDSATALALFGVYGYGKIFRTRDFGNSWQDLTHNLPEIPVHCALILPYDTTQIWIGTDVGLFISRDNGQSWQYANGNLPAASIRRLKIINKEIIAVTHGRGIWSLHDENLPELVVPVLPPELKAINPPHPRLNTTKIFFRTRAAYDSVHVDINDETYARLPQVRAYLDTFVVVKVEPPDYLDVQVIGFKDGRSYFSNAMQQMIYEAVDSVNISFNSGFSDFYGDLTIDKPQGFSTAGLQSDHPYKDMQDYVAILGTPLKIGEKYHLIYKDIALVEPGEEGHFYPDQQMWDYVTVEGSTDGENWRILITPYDARLNKNWLSYYNDSKNPDDGLYVQHDIDLDDFYSAGDYVYLRFRLHADPYTHGWGWIIDDVHIAPAGATGMAESTPPVSFKVWEAYPNPFNPSTTIRFTLDRTEKVSLKIYNAAGQLVRTLLDDAMHYKGNEYRYIWHGRNDFGNPVASGIYFFKVETPHHHTVRKMVLLR
jgi:photosystem II stability/assembly factor-like uncharacterized protein